MSEIEGKYCSNSSHDFFMMSIGSSFFEGTHASELVIQNDRQTGFLSSFLHVVKLLRDVHGSHTPKNKYSRLVPSEIRYLLRNNSSSLLKRTKLLTSLQ